MIGKTIYNYTIEILLGQGGMGDVYLAVNKLGNQAAVKVLHEELLRNESIKSRFIDEARTMMKMDHPNILTVYDIGEVDGRPFILMEYLEGETLFEGMARGRKFSQPEIIKIYHQLLEALAHIHSKDVIHRDIKPSNIFLTSKGDVRILDFGISKDKDNSSYTSTGQIIGTLLYMSPEQVRSTKDVSFKTDYYSLGVSLLHLITGKAPYDQSSTSSFDIQSAIVHSPLSLEEVPKPWQAVLGKLLEKNPEARIVKRYDEKVGTAYLGVESSKMENHSGARVNEGRSFLSSTNIKFLLIPLIAIVLFAGYKMIGQEQAPLCDTSKLAILIASFSDSEQDSFAYKITNEMDRIFADSVYECRPVGKQSRQISRYQEHITESYFDNGCDTSGIFVNGLLTASAEKVDIFAHAIRIPHTLPIYVDTMDSKVQFPAVLSFSCQADPALIADFFQTYLFCHSSVPDDCIQETINFQNKHKITRESQKIYGSESILNPLNIIRADAFAIQGDEERAHMFYKEVEKSGSAEWAETASLRRIKATEIKNNMVNDPELRKIRAKHLRAHERLERKNKDFFQSFIDAIAKFLNNLF